MHKSFRKSQAALEFLMTYGWAILVVLVAIGALAYFGVLNPDKFLPSKCTLPAGIACTDFKLTAGLIASGPDANGIVTIVLRNGMGFDATDVSVTVTGCTTNGAGTLANGQQNSFSSSGCTLTGGSKFSGDVNVTYTNADTNLVHKVQGSITARTE